jgi:hypothetical protein
MFAKNHAHPSVLTHPLEFASAAVSEENIGFGVDREAHHAMVRLD